MRVALLSAALGLLATAAAAQTFEPGYVVRLAGDTLRGEIENHFWKEPPTAVRFRPAPAAPVVQLRPGQLRAFRLSSGRYFRADLLPIDRHAETNLNLLPRGLVIAQQPDSVLAEVLVEGPATLLRMVLPGATHYFVKREQQPYLELTGRRYLREVQGRLIDTDANDYRAQLGQYFGDCAAVTGQLPSRAFTAPDLLALVQAYNQQCASARQPGAEYLLAARPRRRVSWAVGVLGGTRYSTVRLQRNAFFYPPNTAPVEPATLDNLQLDGRLHPSGGFYTDLLMPGRQLALHAEVGVSSFGRRGTVAARAAVPAARFEWRGYTTTWRLGLRYFGHLGSEWQLHAGTGFAFDRSWGLRSSIVYGDGQSRTVGRLTVPGWGTFVGAPPNTFPYSLFSWPYLELGLSHRRWSVILDGRLLPKATLRHEDQMVVSVADDAPSTFYWGQYYAAGRSASLGLRLAYRLTRNPDDARPRP